MATGEVKILKEYKHLDEVCNLLCGNKADDGFLWHIGKLMLDGMGLTIHLQITLSVTVYNTATCWVRNRKYDYLSLIFSYECSYYKTICCNSHLI